MVRTLVLYLCLALLALLCIADASDIKLQPAGGPQRRFLLKNATPDEVSPERGGTEAVDGEAEWHARMHQACRAN